MKKTIERLNIKTEYLYPILMVSAFLLIPITKMVSVAYGVTILQQFFGLLGFVFVPGYLITKILFKNRLALLDRLSFSIGFSLLVPPTILFLAFKSNLNHFLLDFNTVFVLYSAIIISLLIIYFLKNTLLPSKENGERDENLLKELHRERKTILFLLSVIIFFNFLSFVFNGRQPNIITLDASYFYGTVKESIETGHYPKWKIGVFPLTPETYQPLLQSESIALTLLSDIDLVFLFRFGMVIIFSTLFVPLFQVIKTLTGDETISKISLLFFFLSPVLVSESIICRPQSVFFLLSPLFLYSLLKYINQNNDSVGWLISSIIIMVTSWSLHYLSLFFVPLLLLAIITKNFQWIKGHKLKAITWIVLSLLLLFPYLRDFGVFFKVKYLFDSVVKSYGGIDILRNTFGITTYAANHAFLLIPLSLLSIYLLSTKRIRGGSGIFLILSYTFSYFFFLEIVPRLGFSFLPDRANPHLALGLIFISSLSLQWILDTRKKIYGIIVIILAVPSLLATVYVNSLPTYQTINTKEIDAIKFINQQDGLSLVITQFSNLNAINEFGSFRMLDIPQEQSSLFFREPHADASYNQIKDNLSLKNNLLRSREIYIKDTITLISEDSSLLEKTKGKINLDLYFIDQINSQIRELDEITKKSGGNVNIYILYSTIKNRSFFSRYDWWKVSNYPDANLEKFDDQRYYEKVFDNNDVIIWKVRKEVTN